MYNAVKVHQEGERNSRQKPTPSQLIGSMLSAAIGIQSRKSHERDFTHGKVTTFVIAGIVFGMVKLILDQNGY